jgi:hypothetical protein
MTEQMPGELIYEYTIQPTGATSYGVPALARLLRSRHRARDCQLIGSVALPVDFRVRSPWVG